MGKLYVDTKVQTSVDGVREELTQAESSVGNLGSESQRTLQLLRSLDRIEEGLQKLASRGADVRVERKRFETVLQKVRRQRRCIVGSERDAVERARAQDRPGASRWWWFLDQEVARERREAWVRRIGIGALVATVLAAAWLGYQEFLAPPAELREAYRHIESGKSAADAGNLGSAMAEFELARNLTPDNPEPWLWGGVLCERSVGCAHTESLYQTARGLYSTPFDFLLNRGRVYLELGQLGEARADVEAAIELNQDSGWGYYFRAGVHVRDGDYDAALHDLQLAADLAEQSGDGRLHSMAVTQRAQLVRLHPPAMLE